MFWAQSSTIPCVMRCPNCGEMRDRVVDTRPLKGGTVVRRRRQCLRCQTRYTTYEEIESLPLQVIKRDGRVQDFDRAKLLAGIQKACEKRPVGREAVEHLADLVIEQAKRRHGHKIPSHVLGELVLRGLRVLDPVAYVRFASVYKKFEDIGDFQKLLQSKEEPEQGLLFDLVPKNPSAPSGEG
jgi:transcriptional repressor NrdR